MSNYNFVLSFLSSFAANKTAAKALISVITETEFENKSLSKETMQTLGLKGSPKLSKVLLSFGIPKQKIDLALAGGKVARTRVLCENLEDLWAQGNSVHYSSCQATDGRAAWNGSDDHVAIAYEVEHYGSDLLLWVAGDRMSDTNDEGFKARAKLRVMYKDEACTEVAGLYIDRPYGQFNILLEDIFNLLKGWKSFSRTDTPLLMPPVWQREDGASADFQTRYGGRYHTPLYCRSATGGYQDTMTQGVGPYDFFHAIDGEETKNAVVEAYKSRQFEGGVYLTSYQDVVWNPQKWTFQNPKIKERNARTPMGEVIQQKLESFRKLLGLKFTSTVDVMNEHAIVFDSNIGANCSIRRDYRRWPSTHTVYELFVEFKKIAILGEEYLEVVNDLPELGFHKGNDFPYEINEEGLVVLEFRDGFCPALDLCLDPLLPRVALCPKSGKMLTHKYVNIPNDAEDWFYVDGFAEAVDLPR